MESKEETHQIINQLTTEKDSLDESFVNARKLLDEAIEQSQTSGKKNGQSEDGFTYTSVMPPNRVKIAVRVKIPEKEHPNYNFIGKLLGPKGSSLKQLQADTGTRMSILGRNSMRDKVKEEEMRNSGDPKHNHLTAELHVMIEAYCSAAEAYSRIGHALTEIKKYLIPDPNDEIRQTQLLEMGMPGGPPSRGGGRGRGRGGPGRGMPRPLGVGPQSRTPQSSRGGPRGAPRGRGMVGRGRSAPMSLAYPPQEEEYYEEPYGESYEGSYEAGYEETGTAADASYGYGDTGASDYDYGGYSEGTQGTGYGTAATTASASYGGYGGSGSSWGSGSGGGNQRMKAPSQGYAPKTAARSHPYTRY